MDGGDYLLFGTQLNYGYSDFWMARTDSSGSIIWEEFFGEYWTDICYDAIQTSDNNIVMVGAYDPNEYASDYLILKTTINGVQLWNKTYGTTYGVEKAISTYETANNHLLVAGNYGDNVYVVNIDESGNHQWGTMFGGAETDTVSSVIETSSGNVMIIGTSESYGSGNKDMWLIKTDASGNHIWNKTFGGSSADEGTSIIELADGNFALFGGTSSSGAGSSDFWLVPVDSDGNQLASYTFGDTGWEIVHDAVQTATNEFVMVGPSSSYAVGLTDYWLVKIQLSLDTTSSASSSSSSESTSDQSSSSSSNGDNAINGQTTPFYFDILTLAILIVFITKSKHKH